MALRGVITFAVLTGHTLAAQALYAQCGGESWTGDTACQSGSKCTKINDWYSQCLPLPATTLSTVISSTTTHVAATTGKVRLAGVNIAGFDFGVDTSGNDNTVNAFDIASVGNGPAQMEHFVQDSGFNAFRLPVGWQYLLNSNLGGTLDPTNFGKYDKLVQACLSSGATTCIIDVHNYARWDGGIIGQGGPTNDQFASLWTQLAVKYGANTKIILGLVNEPHDLDVPTWAQSVQAAVTAIRKACAATNTILLPGAGYTSAETFVSSGSAVALDSVTNPDNSKDGLVFDVHKYLDSDNSGTHTDCVTNNIDTAFVPLATWLRADGRTAFLTETGGGNTDSCQLYLCQQLDYLNQNSDVYLGYVGWAASGFDQSYDLVETPIQNGDSFTDQPLVQQCLAAQFNKKA